MLTNNIIQARLRYYLYTSMNNHKYKIIPSIFHMGIQVKRKILIQLITTNLFSSINLRFN